MKIRSRIKNRNAKSANIMARILAHPKFQAANHILIYVSMRSEVQTHQLIKRLLQDEEKTVYIPYCHGDVLRVFELAHWDQLTRKTFGVLEPSDQHLRSSYQPPSEPIELTLVPGVAFDENRNRIGYGKGFYDQLLTHSVTHSFRLALAFAQQVFDAVPCEPYDVPMHEIVTEEGIVV